MRYKTPYGTKSLFGLRFLKVLLCLRIKYVVSFLQFSMLQFSCIVTFAQPSFVWAGKMGGTSSTSAPSDVGRSIALDKSGNVYTTGNFWGNADFNPSAGVYILNSAGVSDVFISKLDSAGNFVWGKRFGGTNYDNGNDIAVDDSGYLYLVGSFQSAVDFDPGPGVYTLTPLGYRDVFICKLDANGGFVWARQFGGELPPTDQVDATGVAVDASGNVYTTGSILYGKADFDPGPGVFNLSTSGDFDIFISKLNRNGDFEWARRIGGLKRDSGNAIAVDENGNACLTGYFTGSVDFDPDTGIRNLTTSQFSKDIFICRFNSSGALNWAHQIGVQNGDDVGEDIAVDGAGNVYTTGSYYYGGTDFNPDTTASFPLNAASSSDIFICKWDSAARFIWAGGIGVSGLTTKSYSVAVKGNSVGVTGYFGGRAGLSIDFDPGPGVYNLSCNPGTTSNSVNIFALQLDTAGQFACAGWMGGPTGIVTNTGFGIAVDGVGGMYITGQYVSTADFNPDSIGTYFLTTTNALDDEEIFVCKLKCAISVPQLPVADFYVADTAICLNACVDFTNLSEGASSFLWKFPGADISTDTSRSPVSICYSQPGIYDVILVARNSFGFDTLRKTNYISSLMPDTASILVAGNDTLFCAGDSIQLCASGIFRSYQWNTGDTSACIYAKLAGGYWLTTTDANGCAASSPHQNLKVFPVPPVSVSVNGDTLLSFYAKEYQWYLNGDAIPGANGQIYVAQITGLYSVAVVDSNGCHATSNEVYFLITGIPDDDGALSIYPNPSGSNQLFIKAPVQMIGSQVTIYDDNGRLVNQSEIRKEVSEINLEVARGIYYVHFKGANISLIKKIVKL